MSNRTIVKERIHNLGDDNMTAEENIIVKGRESEKFTKVVIDGEHGKINISIPERDPTVEEWRKFNEDMTKIIYSNR